VIIDDGHIYAKNRSQAKAIYICTIAIVRGRFKGAATVYKSHVH